MVGMATFWTLRGRGDMVREVFTVQRVRPPCEDYHSRAMLHQILPDSPADWDCTMKEIQTAINDVAKEQTVVAEAVCDPTLVPVRVTVTGKQQELSVVAAIETVDEAVSTILNSLTSTHDMTRALFALYGAHNSAITTATYQLSQQMEVHAAAVHAKEKEELAEQRAELNKLHAQFLHNQAITNARVEELETSIKVILADYKILKERVDAIETVNLPESPVE
jgi:hypothetical protein